MILNRIKGIRLIISRFNHLGGLRLVPVFFRALRQRGLADSLGRVWRLLFWDQGVNYLYRAQRWYRDNGCQDLSDQADELFSRANVLIIGNLDLPQCKKYRVMQKVELLEKGGISCPVSHYRDIPRVFNHLQLATLILFYRVPDGDLYRRYIEEARRLRITCGYDIDDPILDTEIYTENKNLDTLAPEEKKELLNSSRLYRSAMQACQFVTVSTPGMERIVRAFYNGNIYLWRNVLDNETLSMVAELNTGGEDNPGDDTVLIAYMSGSRAHDADFASVSSSLSRVMARYPAARLLVGGYARIPRELEAYSDRTEQVPFTGYRGYFTTLARADINLVPLLHDRFNNCKSAIRFLEAAVLAIPTIVSDIGDFHNLISSGKNGILATTEDEWEEGLAALIESEELRRQIGKNSRRYVLEQQTVDSLSREIRETVTEFPAPGN